MLRGDRSGVPVGGGCSPCGRASFAVRASITGKRFVRAVLGKTHIPGGRRSPRSDVTPTSTRGVCSRRNMPRVPCANIAIFDRGCPDGRIFVVCSRAVYDRPCLSGFPGARPGFVGGRQPCEPAVFFSRAVHGKRWCLWVPANSGTTVTGDPFLRHAGILGGRCI